MPKNKCGLNPKQREKILHDNGFERARTGKGSHELWEHDGLKLLAHTHRLEPPANLRSPGFAQSAWQITLPDDPASGTWNSLVKYAKWCKAKTDGITAASAHEHRRVAFAGAFNQAARPQSKRERKQERKAKIRAFLNSGVHSAAPV
ncbi:MAG: hypothetical protein KGL10_07995 [Alphaproteobacteria bacterium]|nr:hypothetical protein [Alphaproteobacteria bacterium]MDE2337239.1 hypothetical protein [Alphaproteobacteria bacterium]